MNTVSLAASPRDKTTAKALRRHGIVPCVLYGFGVKNLSLQCEAPALQTAFAKAGKSTLVELSCEEKTIPVLFHAVETHPVTDRIIHVDFYAVNMKEEIETTVPIRFTGEAPAVKNLGAILVTPLTSVTVRCLPQNLPHDLPVSVDSLEEFHATLSVGDLTVPEGVMIVEKTDVVIATIQEPREEEEIAPPAPAAGAEAPVAPEGEAPAAEEGETTEKKPEKKEDA